MTTYHRDDFIGRWGYRATIWRYLRPAISGWWADRMARIEQRRAVKAMAEMPDWQLRDIGLNRGDIDRLVQQHKIELDPVQIHPPH